MPREDARNHENELIPPHPPPPSGGKGFNFLPLTKILYLLFSHKKIICREWFVIKSIKQDQGRVKEKNRTEEMSLFLKEQTGRKAIGES